MAEQAATKTEAPTGEALTDEQIERHTLLASQCPPDSRVLLVSSVRRLRAALAPHPSAPVAPKFEAERETVQRCIDRAKQWLVDGATGEPPRTEVALLWTLAQATLDLPENAAPAVQPVAPVDAVGDRLTRGFHLENAEEACVGDEGDGARLDAAIDQAMDGK